MEEAPSSPQIREPVPANVARRVINPETTLHYIQPIDQDEVYIHKYPSQMERMIIINTKLDTRLTDLLLNFYLWIKDRHSGEEKNHFKFVHSPNCEEETGKEIIFRRLFLTKTEAFNGTRIVLPLIERVTFPIEHLYFCFYRWSAWCLSEFLKDLFLGISNIPFAYGKENKEIFWQKTYGFEEGKQVSPTTVFAKFGISDFFKRFIFKKGATFSVDHNLEQHEIDHGYSFSDMRSVFLWELLLPKSLSLQPKEDKRKKRKLPDHSELPPPRFHSETCILGYEIKNMFTEIHRFVWKPVPLDEVINENDKLVEFNIYRRNENEFFQRMKVMEDDRWRELYSKAGDLEKQYLDSWIKYELSDSQERRISQKLYDHFLPDIETLLKHLVNKDEEIVYPKSLLASICQNPKRKGYSTILVNYNRQGSGKSFLWEEICQRLFTFAHNVVEKSCDLTGKFTYAYAEKLLLVLNELTVKEQEHVHSTLKKISTGGLTKKEEKNKHPVIIENNTRVVITPDKPFAVYLDGNENRRLLCLNGRADDDWISDHDFWDRIFRHLENPVDIYILYQYLLNYDLSEVNFAKNNWTEYKGMLQAVHRFHSVWIFLLWMSRLALNKWPLDNLYDSLMRSDLRNRAVFYENEDTDRNQKWEPGKTLLVPSRDFLCTYSAWLDHHKKAGDEYPLHGVKLNHECKGISYLRDAARDLFTMKVFRPGTGGQLANYFKEHDGEIVYTGDFWCLCTPEEYQTIFMEQVMSFKPKPPSGNTPSSSLEQTQSLESI